MKGNWVIYLIAIMGLSCSTAKRHYGNYFNNKRYWGAMYVLKEDSTFDFTRRTNAGTVSITTELSTSTITKTTDSYIFSDSSYGYYKLMGDTVLLTYFTEEVKGDFNGYNIRPKKLLWEKKKLYYFFENTNLPIRQKEYFMQLSRFKIPNLKRHDENYVLKQ